MPTIEVQWEDFLHDMEESLSWVEQANRDIILSVAQLDQCGEAAVSLGNVLRDASKLEFLAEGAQKNAGKMDVIANDILLQAKQAEATKTYLDTILEKTKTQPETEQLIAEYRSLFVQTIQLARVQYDETTKMGEKTQEKCESVAEDTKAFIHDVVTRAVIINHDDTLDYISWAGSAADMALTIADIANPEPISAYAVIGIRLLIKAVVTGCQELTIYVKQKDMTLDEALDQMEPLDIAKAKVRDIKEIVDWALQPLTLIKTIGPIVKGVISTAIRIYLDAPISAAQSKLDEAEKEKNASLAAQIMEGFGEQLKDGFKDTMSEALSGAWEQFKDFVSDSKTPEEFISTMVLYVMGSLLEPVLAKIVDPAQPVTRENIESVVGGLDTSAAAVFEKDFITEKVQEKLDTAGAGTSELQYSPEDVRTKNIDVLDKMVKGQEAPVYVGASPVLDSVSDGVAMLIGGLGAGHREADLHYVLSLLGGEEGTVKMVAKGGLTAGAGTLQFTGVPKDLVKRYIAKTGITRKTLKFN